MPTEHHLTNVFWDVLLHQGTVDGISSYLQLPHGSLNSNALLYSASIALLLQMFLKSRIAIFQMERLSSLGFCESHGAHLSWIPDIHLINSHSWE